jgi:hypothetical protein
MSGLAAGGVALILGGCGSTTSTAVHANQTTTTEAATTTVGSMTPPTATSTTSVPAGSTTTVTAPGSPSTSTGGATPTSPTTYVAPPPTHPVSAGAMAKARREAAQLLTLAIVPSDSKPAAALPGRLLAGPASSEACNPLVTDTRRWLVAGTPAQLVTFLADHVPHSLTSSGTGTLTQGKIIESYSQTDTPKAGPTSTELGFSWAAVGSRTGLRADAVVVPRGADCMSSG